MCFVLVAKKVLITPQCFGYCWAVLTQHQGRLSNIPLPSPSKACRQGVGKILGGNTTRKADPNWPVIFHAIWHLLSDKIQVKGGGGGEGVRYYSVWLPEQSLHVLKPYFLRSGWTSPSDGKWKIVFLFSFTSVCGIFFCFIKLSLPWPMNFFILFSPPPVLLSSLLGTWHPDKVKLPQSLLVPNRGHDTVILLY